MIFKHQSRCAVHARIETLFTPPRFAVLLLLLAFFAIGKGQDCALISEVASRRVFVNDDKLSFDGTLLPTGFYTGCSEICYEIRVVFLSDEVMYDQLRFRVDTLMIPTNTGTFQYEATTGRAHTWVTDVSGSTNDPEGQTKTICFYIKQDPIFLIDPAFFRGMVHPHAWLAAGCDPTDTLFFGKIIPTYLNEIGQSPTDTIYLSDIAVSNVNGAPPPGQLLTPAQTNNFGLSFWLRGTLVIDTTYRFNSPSRIFFDPGARILVQHTGAGSQDTLLIRYALLQGCLSRMWEGIEVCDDEVLRMEYSIVKDARTAVTVGEQSRFEIGPWNDFKQNHRNIVIQRLQGHYTPRVIHDNHFMGGPLRDPAVSLSTYTGVEVRGTEALVALYRNDYRDMHTGLLMLNGLAADVHSYWTNMDGSAINAQNSLLYQSGRGNDEDNIIATGSTAIALTNTFAHIRKNGMAKVPTGVGAWLTWNKYVLIDNNRIDARRYGVDMRYNTSPLTTGLTVSDNELHIAGDGLAARGILVRGLGHLDAARHRLYENRVDMYDFDTGIELQSAAQSEVVANAVLLHQGGNALKMSYSPESRIDHNSFHALLAVSATSAMDVRLSPKSTLSCNCTDGTAYGFFSFDDNHDLMLRGNSFGQHVVGLQLGLDLPGMPLVSVIGPQPHSGNTWNFPDMLGGINVAPLQDDVKKSKFTVHTPQGTIYHPLVETPNCGGCEQDWFVQEEGTPFTCAEPCAAVPESPEAMPEGVSALDREIAAGAWSLPNFPDEQRWTAQAHLYRQLAADSSLLEGEPLLQDFYQQKDAADLGQLNAVQRAMEEFFGLGATDKAQLQTAWNELDTLFAQLEQVLQQLQQPPTLQDSLTLVQQRDSLLGEMNSRALALQTIYHDWRPGKESEVAALHALNDAVMPTTLPAANRQQVNRILIDHLLSETDSLGPAEIATLLTIAFQCPLRGGDAVYQARALLSDTLQYDDAALCQSTQQQLALPAPAETTDALELKLWPNPADEVLVLETDRVPEDRVEAVIVDATGVEVVLEKLERGQRTWTLLLPELPAGLYHLSIRNVSGQNLAHQRFLIVR